MRNNGFTMVELLIAAVLTFIFALAFAQLFIQFDIQMKSGERYYDTNRSVRHAMDVLARDVKEATRVEASFGADDTGDEVLILRLPSIDSDGEPTDVATQFDYVIYELDGSGTVLLRSVDVLGGVSDRNGGTDESDVAIAENIESLLFSSSGTGLGSLSGAAQEALEALNVSITAEKTTRGLDQSSSLDSNLLMRNKI